MFLFTATHARVQCQNAVILQVPLPRPGNWEFLLINRCKSVMDIWSHFENGLATVEVCIRSRPLSPFSEAV